MPGIFLGVKFQAHVFFFLGSQYEAPSDFPSCRLRVPPPPPGDGTLLRHIMIVAKTLIFVEYGVNQSSVFTDFSTLITGSPWISICNY